MFEKFLDTFAVVVVAIVVLSSLYALGMWIGGPRTTTHCYVEYEPAATEMMHWQVRASQEWKVDPLIGTAKDADEAKKLVDQVCPAKR